MKPRAAAPSAGEAMIVFLFVELTLLGEGAMGASIGKGRNLAW
jgi:hypothetical protein